MKGRSGSHVSWLALQAVSTCSARHWVLSLAQHAAQRS